MTDEQLDDNIGAEPTDAAAPLAHDPQYGVGPFSIREVALGGVWLVAFVVSFFSLTVARFDSVWTSGILWILAIGVPTAAVFLIGLRRLSPQGIRRVGSLGIDQFASVAFSVSAALWLQIVWETVAFAIQSGVWARSWVMWVELVVMLAGVVLTVAAPFIPPFADDFRGRREVAAHRVARPIRPVTRRPAPATPVPAAPPAADAAALGYGAYEASGTDESATASDEPGPYETRDASEAPAAEREQSVDEWSETSVFETIDAGELDAPSGPEPGSAPTRQQAFWALAPEERDVVDDTGAPIFRIGPSAWALVIEDRGAAFVVRHEDGRIGYLHDVDGVTRG